MEERGELGDERELVERETEDVQERGSSTDAKMEEEEEPKPIPESMLE